MQVDLSQVKQMFQPQPGPQTEFLRTPADIALYGGGAGAGKTYAMVLETLRHHNNPKFRSVVFRRESVQITNPGGLWDEALNIYPAFSAKSSEKYLEFAFPSGFVSKFAHLQYEQDVHKWQGAQIPFIGFDELTHFTEKQFWYMLSRNRSDSGIAGYVRATCNPPDGVNPDELWVAKLVSWWLRDDGFPDLAKSGVLRWFTRIGNEIYWANHWEELVDTHLVSRIDCKSFTFIPATIEDNQILLQNDPAYLSNLRALDDTDRQRLLAGNWRVSSAGTIFNQKDFRVFVINPKEIEYKIITCDTAQKVKEHNDYTVLQCWVLSEKGIYLLDQVRGRYEYPQLRQMSKSFINKHKDANKVFIEDKVAGTSLVQDLLQDSDTKFRNITAIQRNKDKFTRAKEAIRFISSGYVFINPMADYYPEFIQEVTAFRGDLKHTHDDQVDCMLDAVDQLLINKPYFSAPNSGLSGTRIV